MYQSKTKTIYRMSYEEVEVRPDGSETVVRRMMDQIHDDDDDPSGVIGCLIGMMVNSICNANDPWSDAVLAAAIRRTNGLSNPFYYLVDAYHDWDGDEDFEAFVEVQWSKEDRRKQGGDA